MADDIVINFADYAKELRSLAYHRGDHFLYGAAALIEAQQAEIERLRKRLQLCQSDDSSPLTDDVITQNERFLLAENDRLRTEHNYQEAEIGRLRADLTQLRWVNRRLSDLYEGLYHTTEEARRGD